MNFAMSTAPDSATPAENENRYTERVGEGRLGRLREPHPGTAESILPLYTALITEATPAFASGTAPITESVEGAMTLPIPNDMKKKVGPRSSRRCRVPRR